MGDVLSPPSPPFFSSSPRWLERHAEELFEAAELERLLAKARAATDALAAAPGQDGGGGSGSSGGGSSGGSGGSEVTPAATATATPLAPFSAPPPSSSPSPSPSSPLPAAALPAAALAGALAALAAEEEALRAGNALLRRAVGGRRMGAAVGRVVRRTLAGALAHWATACAGGPEVRARVRVKEVVMVGGGAQGWG